MKPNEFMTKYSYIVRIDYDAQFKICFFTDVNDAEMAALEFNGSAYTDAKSVDIWARANCIKDTSWDRKV